MYVVNKALPHSNLGHQQRLRPTSPSKPPWTRRPRLRSLRPPHPALHGAPPGRSGQAAPRPPRPLLRHPRQLPASKLINFYSKTNNLNYARKVFDQIPHPNAFSWNAMLVGYSLNNVHVDTLKLFWAMVSSCSEPDNFTVTCVLKALGALLSGSKLAKEECKELYREMISLGKFRPVGLTAVSVLQACLQSNDLMLGMEVHQFVNENQIKMDVLHCNALIGLYARCGSSDYAQELFDEMSEKDEVTYGSLASGYMFHSLVQNNRHEDALDLTREMQSCGCKPNTVTLSSIFPTILCFSNLKVGKEVHAYAVKNNFDGNIYVATAIIDTYAKSGFLNGAQRAFDQAKCMSLIIWKSIISAYTSHGDADTPLSILYKMLNNGIQPDHVTFTTVLTACSHSGVVDEAWKIFDAMFPKYAIFPSVEHYACMVGVLSRAGKLSEAADFIHKMPVEPSAKVWGALLNGASVSCDFE
ncbi:hypothetical protein ACFX2A_033286 [Malus domestica]